MSKLSLSEIRSVIVIPTYNETDSLKSFLHNLLFEIDSNIGIIVCDDSGPKLKSFFQDLENELIRMYKTKIHFDFTCQKSGRGSAVLRGLLLARNKFPKAINFVECDADESHRVEDVLRVLKVGQKNDFVIGSRYLRDSQILGWPFSRRVFSRGLNIVIPKLLQLEIRDITNGLRSYSVKATDILLSHQFMNSGFIMLSEIALLLGDRRIVPYELPSIFVNRRLGNSTVTKVEIVDSLTGLLNLFIKYRLSWRLR